MNPEGPGSGDELGGLGDGRRVFLGYRVWEFRVWGLGRAALAMGVLFGGFWVLGLGFRV